MNSPSACLHRFEDGVFFVIVGLCLFFSFFLKMWNKLFRFLYFAHHWDYVVIC